VKVRCRNNVDGASEYLLELALKSREVEQTSALIEVDKQVDVRFLVIHSLSDTSEDPGISAAVGSDDAKDERTILRQDLTSGRDALKAQEAGHLRLASSDRGTDLSLAEARRRPFSYGVHEHCPRLRVQLVGLPGFDGEDRCDGQHIANAINGAQLLRSRRVRSANSASGLRASALRRYRCPASCRSC
jgi:hypothetical protein